MMEFDVGELGGRPWGAAFPLLGIVAMVGIFAGVRRRRDAWPFTMTVPFSLAAFATLAVLFWPYMIPNSITVGNAAAPESSLSFFVLGRGRIRPAGDRDLYGRRVVAIPRQGAEGLRLTDLVQGIALRAHAGPGEHLTLRSSRGI